MRQFLIAALTGAALFFISSPSRALERLVLRLPFLETSVTINLGDVQSTSELIRQSPDLADLQMAGGSRVYELIEKVFLAPLPVETKAFLKGSTGQPVLEQALLAATALVELEGIAPDSSGRMLTDALVSAESIGQPNVLGFLRSMPGEQASIDLSKIADAANRLKTNLEPGVALVLATEAASVTSALREPLRGGWSREERRLSVDHRPQPLRLLVLRPTGNDLGRLAVISHGLWDDPESFEGWGELLAANGYTVLLPDHPGSNFSQQQSMLAGDSPPPGPEELRMRPLDVSALLDAVRDGRLLSGQSLDINSVAMIGHSWGATTSLQIAGFQPTENKLRTRCVDLNHPERNISWVLQCSWLSGVEQAAALDPRIQVVVAVSPPLRLLFDPTSSKKLLVSKVLLVSGTRDWVVPSGPEAITPMRETGAAQMGHRLVLVKGADHFNLRSFRGEERPALIGPVILAWLNEQLGVDSSVTFSGGGWGDSQGRLVDVSSSL